LVNIKKESIKIIEYPKNKNDELMSILAELEFETSSKNEIADFIQKINSKIDKTMILSNNQDRIQMIFPFEIKIK